MKIDFVDEKGLQYELDFDLRDPWDSRASLTQVRLLISLGKVTAYYWREVVNGKIVWRDNERIVGKLITTPNRDAKMSDEAKEYFDKAMKLLAFV